jgi:hypothetical protein
MKRLILSTFILFAALAAAAQPQISLPAHPDGTRIALSAGEAIAFTRTGYQEGYETVRTTVRAAAYLGSWHAGLGIDLPGGDRGGTDISARAGFTLGTDAFSVDGFAVLQRGLGHSPVGSVTLGGGGLLAEFRFLKPLSAFIEYRAMYPFFLKATSPYYNSWYGASVAALSFGITVNI